MIIQGKKTILRAVEEDDFDILYELINDPEIEKMVGGWSWPVSKVQQRQWIQNVDSSSTSKRFIIEYEGKAVGLFVLKDIDWKNRKAFTGIKLSSSCPKRQGIGTDAVMAMERYAFEELQLNRLESTIIDYNIASENLHLKCGWVVEGTQRKAVFKNNTFHDLKVISILNLDYFRFIQNFNYWALPK